MGGVWLLLVELGWRWEEGKGGGVGGMGMDNKQTTQSVDRSTPPFVYLPTTFHDIYTQHTHTHKPPKKALLAQLDHEISRQSALLLAAQSDAFGNGPDSDNDSDGGGSGSVSKGIIGTTTTTAASSQGHGSHSRVPSLTTFDIQPLPSPATGTDGALDSSLRSSNRAVARHFLLAQQARLAAQLEVRNAEAAAYVEHRCVFCFGAWVDVDVDGCGWVGLGEGACWLGERAHTRAWPQLKQTLPHPYIYTHTPKSTHTHPPQTLTAPSSRLAKCRRSRGGSPATSSPSCFWSRGSPPFWPCPPHST